MTEEKKSMVPKLRFPEFTETWEQRELKDVAEIVGGGTPSTSVPAYWNGSIDWYSPTEIGQENFAKGSKRKISNEGLKNSSAKLLPAHKTILFTSRATIGEAAILEREGATNQGFQSIVTKEGVDVYFLYSYKHHLKKQALIKASGSTFLEISKNEVEGLHVPVPSGEEQAKIGSFFKLVDKAITLHQRKLDVLNKLKKYLLQKMFPENGQLIPELRFPAFSGAWEQRKLSEIVRMNARIGWQNLRQSEFLDDGDFLLITGTDFKNGRVNFGTCHYIAKERFDQDPKIQVEEGSILLTKDGTIGKVALVDKLSKPATLNAGVYNIVPKNRVVESRFLFQYLSAPFLLDYVNKAATGGTIKHLNQSILVDFPVSFPSVAEQEKIGKFLEGIDHVTTLHQRKLEGLRKLKKSLLQQMFV